MVDEYGLPVMLALANADKRHHDHAHTCGPDTRDFRMYLMPNPDERRAVTGLCSMQVNPLMMAEAERSNPDIVQNDDFHLGKVW